MIWTNLRKIHKITLTQENTISFLQNLKLLPIIPKTDEKCGVHDSHDWYLAKYQRLTDGKLIQCKFFEK